MNAMSFAKLLAAAGLELGEKDAGPMPTAGPTLVGASELGSAKDVELMDAFGAAEGAAEGAADGAEDGAEGAAGADGAAGAVLTDAHCASGGAVAFNAATIELVMLL